MLDSALRASWARAEARRAAAAIPASHRRDPDRVMPGTSTEWDRHDLSRRIRSLRTKLQTICRRHESLMYQMQLAEQVQRSLLPTAFPRVPGVRFAAAYQPLDYMAGDFYNAFRLDHDRVGFYVGDVMGHGPAAALLSVLAMQSLRTKRIEANSYEVLGPATVLGQLSEMLLRAELPNEPFLTMVYGVLDLSRRTWRYCNGGHPPPMVLRPGREPTKLEVTGPLLGAVEIPFAETEYVLQPGDRLVLYSDGVQSAGWGERGPGLEGLCQQLEPGTGQPAQDQLNLAMQGLGFNSVADGDDVTVLVVDLDGG